LDLYHHLSGQHVLEDIESQLDEYRTKLDRLTRAQEQLMATATEVLTLVTQVKAYVETLKLNQKDPAEQAAIDQAAAELGGLLPPPTP
jgi:hypothetical protein